MTCDMPPFRHELSLWRAQVVVSSVDGYQGREADVIVFSAVRCNEMGSLGFVADPRRVNVAITRPRRSAIACLILQPLSRSETSSWGQGKKLRPHAWCLERWTRCLERAPLPQSAHV